MSDKGRGRSRGRASQRSAQTGSSQQLPHAQLSTTTQVSRRPGQQAPQPTATVNDIIH